MDPTTTYADAHSPINYVSSLPAVIGDNNADTTFRFLGFLAEINYKISGTSSEVFPYNGVGYRYRASSFVRGTFVGKVSK